MRRTILLLSLALSLGAQEPKHVLTASLGVGAQSGVEAQATGDFSWKHNGKDLFLRTWAGQPVLRAAYALPLWIGDPLLFVAPGLMVEHGHVHPAVGVTRLLTRASSVYTNHTARHQIAGAEWLIGKGYRGVKLGADYHFLAGNVKWWSVTVGPFWQWER